MKKPLTVLASLVAVLAAAGGTAAPQDGAKAAPPVKEVMVTMTIPASEAIFSAASEPPKEAAQWVALRASVSALAESGRVLLTSAHKNDQEWAQMARAMTSEAEAMFKAIDAKDADALSQAGDDVYATCKTCHDRFMGR